jgi:hypothetical protein
MRILLLIMGYDQIRALLVASPVEAAVEAVHLRHHGGDRLSRVIWAATELYSMMR